ncbi:MAG: efflux RND transporter periplasmic adaptor subunit [Deltaproteobacteria bacterium]|jgi:RND family efflux transporter MFP subunit|nr:efflux RND transporter periplasmic adaptor subunit [Deltaproteobacteria bacterium]
MKKTIAFLIVAGLIALLGWRLYQGYTAKQGQVKTNGNRAVAVRTEPVRMMTVRDIRVFTGSLRAESTFYVASKVGGRLEKVAVHIGEKIRQGQMVARIEAAEYRQQVEEARAEFEVAKARIVQCRARLNLVEIEFKRVRTLREKNISSASEFDKTESELKAAQAELMVLQAQVDQKEAALKAAQIRLGYTELKAVWENGSDVRYVGERFVDEGQMLSANTPILSIVNIKTLNAVVNAIEQDYPYLKQGQEAVITTDAFPGSEFKGTVWRISNILQESTRQAEVEIRVPNPDLKLKPGMFVRVRIQFARHANATAVPEAALVGYHGKSGVYLLSADEKSVSFVPVEKGIEDDGWVEVVSPPLSGNVVTIGHQLLKDGAAVVVPGPASGHGDAGASSTGALKK